MSIHGGWAHITSLVAAAATNPHSAAVSQLFDYEIHVCANQQLFCSLSTLGAVNDLRDTLNGRVEVR